MEIRDIEIFLTLAEELHFGRTAERLYLTQARVSQAIQKQERRFGGLLFVRNSRTVRLTQLGERLRDDLQPIYEQLLIALDRATTTARGAQGLLRVGFIGAAAGHIAVCASALLASRVPELRVQTREVQIIDALSQFRGGGLDLFIVAHPVQEPDIVVGPVLFTERRYLAVPAGHRLAQQPTVSMEDLAHVPLLRFPEGLTERLRADRTPPTTPQGKPIQFGPSFSTIQEALALIGAGAGGFVGGAQLNRYYARPDVKYVPFHDAPPLEWVPIWLTTADPAPITTFISAALEIAAHPFR